MIVELDMRVTPLKGQSDMVHKSTMSGVPNDNMEELESITKTPYVPI